MSKKVKVSKELGEVLSKLLNNSVYKDNYDKLLIAHSITKASATERWTDELSIMDKLSIIDLANILINDYEIGLTPEEKLAEYFHTKVREEYSEFDKGSKLGIMRTLEILGLEIENINK